MIIKKSTRKTEIEQFNFWYNEERLATFSSAVRKELFAHRRGLKGEAETAFYLDRHFSTSADHALIHDLRIQDTPGSYAQFDHVLISRLSKTISIFEVKNFNGRLSKNEHGEWMVWYDGQRRPVDIPNPVEQVRRQRTVLQRWLKRKKLDSFFPDIGCFVVVPPKCAIDRSKISAREPIFKADNVIREWTGFGGISPIGRLLSTGVSAETLRAIGRSLARDHEEPETTIFHRLNVLPEEVKLQLQAASVSPEPHSLRSPKKGQAEQAHDSDEAPPTSPTQSTLNGVNL